MFGEYATQRQKPLSTAEVATIYEQKPLQVLIVFVSFIACIITLHLIHSADLSTIVYNAALSYLLYGEQIHRSAVRNLQFLYRLSLEQAGNLLRSFKYSLLTRT